MSENKFGLQQTNICKGVAICIMMFHHLFYQKDSWELYYNRIKVGSRPLIGYIATQGKICVTIFVLLSAYGLTKSIMKHSLQIEEENTVRSLGKFVVDHIKKLYFLYWPVFVPAMFIGLISGVYNPLTIYKSIGEWIRCIYRSVSAYCTDI